MECVAFMCCFIRLCATGACAHSYIVWQLFPASSEYCAYFISGGWNCQYQLCDGRRFTRLRASENNYEGRALWVYSSGFVVVSIVANMGCDRCCNCVCNSCFVGCYLFISLYYTNHIM